MRHGRGLDAHPGGAGAALGGDLWLDAYAVGNLGLLELGRRGVEPALPHLRSALELFRAIGDVAFEVGFLVNYALAIGEHGRTAEAVALLEEALEKAARVGDRSGQALALVNLGCFLLDAGRAAEAREQLGEAVRMGRQLGMRLVEGVALGEQGRALVALGALPSARGSLEDAVGLLARVSRWHSLRFSAHRPRCRPPRATSWPRGRASPRSPRPRSSRTTSCCASSPRCCAWRWTRRRPGALRTPSRGSGR
ncbi:tetratricopeptide repeat protein [Cystobacter fuscus]